MKRSWATLGDSYSWTVRHIPNSILSSLGCGEIIDDIAKKSTCMFFGLLKLSLQVVCVAYFVWVDYASTYIVCYLFRKTYIWITRARHKIVVIISTQLQVSFCDLVIRNWIDENCCSKRHIKSETIVYYLYDFKRRHWPWTFLLNLFEMRAILNVPDKFYKYLSLPIWQMTFYGFN